MHLSDELWLDRRECERTAVASTITVRPIGGVNHEVRIEDLSMAGCRVELVESAELGELLITRLPQLEPLVGTLRWADGRIAGLAFSKRMHPAVLDAMVAHLR